MIGQGGGDYRKTATHEADYQGIVEVQRQGQEPWNFLFLLFCPPDMRTIQAELINIPGRKRHLRAPRPRTTGALDDGPYGLPAPIDTKAPFS